jgi:hypothetical protein
MATSSVCPFGIWAFNGGWTSPPHWANNAFTYGCAFEHTLIPACPLPSYQKLKFGRVFYLAVWNNIATKLAIFHLP